MVSVIKRNDRLSQWFIGDAIRVHDVIKQTTSGRKLLRIMSYLHICDINKQVSREHTEYDPLLKVGGFQ